MNGSTLDPTKKTDLIKQRRYSGKRHWGSPMPFLLWAVIDNIPGRHADDDRPSRSETWRAPASAHGLESAKTNAVDCRLRKTRTIQGRMDDFVAAWPTTAVIRRGVYAQPGRSDKIAVCDNPALMPEAL